MKIVLFSIIAGWLWFTAAYVTAKCDAVMSRQKTERSSVFISLFTWPLIAWLLIGTNHSCSTIDKTWWEY